MKSVTQVAEELGVTRGAVWFWIQTGKLKAEKVGHQYAIEEAELERFKAQRCPDSV